MSRVQRNVLAGLLASLVIGVAACEDASTPFSFAPQTSRPTGGTSVETEAIDCPSVATGEVALEPLAVVPEPSDPLGSGDDEEGYNEDELPPIPEDEDAEIPDADEFAPTGLPPRGSQGEPQPDDLVLFGTGSTDLRTAHTGQTAEPEVAMKGQRVFMTWNKMAARSLDGGATFGYLPPQTSFALADGGFCCDQRSLHVPRQDLWLWVLQYEQGPDGSNTIRLAWAHGDDEFDAARFHYVDWRPADTGFDEDTWFDQPKIGVSDEHVFLSINAFRTQYVGTVVIRAALQDLVDGRAPRSSCLHTVDPTSGTSLASAYPVRQAGDTMYIAAHWSTSTLAIWSWPDAAASPSFSTVTGTNAAGTAIRYPKNPPYSCPHVTDGASSDWCFRPVRDNPDRSGNDDRITSGWYADGVVGFAWNVSQAEGFPYPFVWAVTLDAARIDACTAGECVLGYPIIRSDSFAYQYGAMAAGPDGSLGGVFLIGGGQQRLGCVIGIRDRLATGWDLGLVEESEQSMPFPYSGDYLGITTDGESPRGWAASCMTWDHEFGEDGGTVVHFARFGRRSDAP